MPHASTRPGRTRSIALACAAAIAATGLTQAGAVASPVRAAASPSVSNLVVTPKKPTKGEGFKVSFKTKAGGQYEVFIATANSGDVLTTGKTKTGTITTKRLGKKLPAGKYTVGVRVIVGEKDKFVRQPLTIKK